MNLFPVAFQSAKSVFLLLLKQLSVGEVLMVLSGFRPKSADQWCAQYVRLVGVTFAPSCEMVVVAGL